MIHAGDIISIVGDVQYCERTSSFVKTKIDFETTLQVASGSS